MRHEGVEANASKWTKPSEGWLKCNVGARWDVHTSRADIGIIIRDHLHKPITYTWKTRTEYASVEEADLMAILRGSGSWR
jgi:hypothetical protein